MEWFCLALALLGISALLSALLGIVLAARPSQALSKLGNTLGPLGAVLACGLGLASLWPWQGEVIANLQWGLPVGSLALGLDATGRIFLVPVFGLGLVCALSGAYSLRHADAREHNLGAHWLFYQLLVLGMALVMAARDAVLFMLAWEVMSVSPFFLIDFNHRLAKVRDAAWVYLVAAHLGAVLLIGFFGLAWHCTGSTSFTLWQQGLLAGVTPTCSSVLFVLALLGFGAKAGLAPVHIWLPEAHPAAPSHASALLSGAMINAGLYGIIRTLTLLAPTGGFPLWWGWLLLLLGLATALTGILKALAQSNLKRLLAYSSVENMGLMLMGLGAGLVGLIQGNAFMAVLGFAGSMLHMLNHAGFKGLLFLCAGEVLHATGTVRMELLGGLQKRLPVVGCAFALGACAIACLPPLSGFAGEFVLALSMLDVRAFDNVAARITMLLALVGLALISGLAAALYAKAYGMTFLGEPRSDFVHKAHHVGIGQLWPLLLPAAFCVAGGLAAPWFFDLATSAVHAAFPAATALAGANAAPGAWVRNSLSTISLWGGLVIALALLLLGMRSMLLSRQGMRRSGTWGCGYQQLTPRIQYTGDSFSQPLADVLAPFMGLRVQRQTRRDVFPGRSVLGVAAPARLRIGFFGPLFGMIESLCNECKIIQHGKIHLYILYILVTVIILLAWGLGA